MYEIHFPTYRNNAEQSRGVDTKHKLTIMSIHLLLFLASRGPAYFTLRRSFFVTITYMGKKPKIVVIVGPTAVGKSGVAIEIAHTFDGEVISADSRQVYRGLDIATGKVTEEEKEGIPHHLLDVADPDERFSVVDFKEKAESAISDILSREKLPIVEGGTGFYIQAIVDNFTPPNVEVNEKLREKLQKKGAEKLYEQLKKLDPRRAEEIDENNPRRLIRAIEIAEELGKVPKREDVKPKYDTLQIGLNRPKDKLRKRIAKRTQLRFDRGMVDEARKLHDNGLSFNRMEELGLEYRYLAHYLQNEITKEELIDKIETGDWQYARKQVSWFKRDDRIEWFHPDELDAIVYTVREFLDK